MGNCHKSHTVSLRNFDGGLSSAAYEIAMSDQIAGCGDFNAVKRWHAGPEKEAARLAGQRWEREQERE